MHLDTWLQERTERDGATIRDHHKVVDVLRTDERVTARPL
jgi:flavin-dependent dehydrogenase